AVDLVRQHQVRKDRPFFDSELVVAGVVDLGTDQVGRQKVRRELDALELGVDRFGQGANGQGLGQAGYAFQKAMATSKEADQHPIEQVILAHNDAADLLFKRLDKDAGLFDLLMNRFNALIHRISS